MLPALFASMTTGRGVCARAENSVLTPPPPPPHTPPHHTDTHKEAQKLASSPRRCKQSPVIPDIDYRKDDRRPYFRRLTMNGRGWRVVPVCRGCACYGFVPWDPLHLRDLTETTNFIRLFVLRFQPIRFLFYFTAAGVKCRVAAIKRLPYFTIFF